MKDYLINVRKKLKSKTNVRWSSVDPSKLNDWMAWLSTLRQATRCLARSLDKSSSMVDWIIPRSFSQQREVSNGLLIKQNN